MPLTKITGGEFDNTQGGLSVAGIITASSDLLVSGNVTVNSGTVTGTRLISNIATGTAPLTVTSTTQVSNLNGSFLRGYSQSDFEGRYTNTIDMSNTGVYAVGNFYPVTIPVEVGTVTKFKLEVALNSGTVPSWSTHPSGFSILLEWQTIGSGWGTNADAARYITTYSESWNTTTICGGIGSIIQDSLEVIWLRGGGRYFLRSSREVTPTPRSANYTSPNGGTANVSSTAINTVFSSATNTFASRRVLGTGYGSLGDYGGLFGQIRVGADQFGNTIKVVNDINMNIATNNSIYFQTGAATDGSTAGTTRVVIDSSGNFQFNSGYGSAATAYGCRAWATFEGSTGAISGSANISSVTRTGTGTYTLNFSTAMPSTNYSFVATCTDQSGGFFINLAGAIRSTTQLSFAGVRVANLSNQDGGTTCFAVFR